MHLPSFKYTLKISYLGHNYNGIQKQNNTKNTIQQLLEEVITKVFHTKISSFECVSRTDKGVHAKENYIGLSLLDKIDEKNFLFKINKNLPIDIRVLEIRPYPDGRSLTSLVKAKTYRYYFTHMIPSANTYAWVDHRQVNFNLTKMKKAAKYFKGKKNFSDFHISGHRNPSVWRVIEKIKVKQHKDNNHIYYIEIKASGFLKYMARYICEALFMYSDQKINKKLLKKSLSGKFHLENLKKAPSKGLSLYKVHFQKNHF